MRILGIETSSRAATVAVMFDGEILCEYTLNHKKTHSQIMQPMVERALSEVGLDFGDIDVFACGTGPGSFTGLRIGVSMTKGFAHSMGKPTAGVSTLKALAENVHGFSGTRVSLIFARADEIFYGIYDKDTSNEGVCTISELIEKVKGRKCIMAGDGSVVFKEEIMSALGGEVVFASKKQNIVSAAAVCMLAEKMAQNGELISYSKLAPVYMRPSQAEREFG